MILSLDPSKRCTGLIIYDENSREIIHMDTYLWEKVKKEYTKESLRLVSKQNQLFNKTFTQWLDYYIGPSVTVIQEYPHGSMNSKAAWGLSAANQAIHSVTLIKTKRTPFCYLERDVKMYAFAQHNVDKKQVMNFMFKFWEERQNNFNHLLSKHQISTLPQREAIADALLVLNYHVSRS